MGILTLWFPAFGFLALLAGGRNLGRKGAQRIFLQTMGGLNLTVWLLGFEIYRGGTGGLGGGCGGWIRKEELSGEFGYSLGDKEVILAGIVAAVVWAVGFYSIGYMAEDPGLVRFLAYLSIFCFSMNLLIIGDNLMAVFVGWELMGLLSLLLVDFYETRIKSGRAGLMALLLNRVGDLGYNLMVFSLFVGTGGLAFGEVVGTLGVAGEARDLAAFFGLIGVQAKSSQVGLHNWLPWAMECPTPVSALLHAATMVCAGVVVLMKLDSGVGLTKDYIGLLGSLTAIMGSSLGLVGVDIKRRIALSTTSQIGYLVLGMGGLAGGHSLYHLTTHSGFKALLFLGAGVLIHGMGNEQDLRRYGGQIRRFPLTGSLLAGGTVALMGLPGSSGGFSKEELLGLVKGGEGGELEGFVEGAVAVVGTAGYSVSLFTRVFIGEAMGSKELYKKGHEGSLQMEWVLFGQGLLALGLGYVLAESFSEDGLGSKGVFGALKGLPGEEGGSLASFVLYLGFGLIIAHSLWEPLAREKALTGGIFNPVFGKKLNFYSVSKALGKMLYFDNLTGYGAKGALRGGEAFNREIDRGIGEVVGPAGLSWLFGNWSLALVKERASFSGSHQEERECPLPEGRFRNETIWVKGLRIFVISFIIVPLLLLL